jgi:hypothetical protein
MMWTERESSTVDFIAIIVFILGILGCCIVRFLVPVCGKWNVISPIWPRARELPQIPASTYHHNIYHGIPKPFCSAIWD